MVRRPYRSGSMVELIPGKKYRVIVSARRDPVTGDRRQASRVVNGSKADAQRALDALRLEVSDRADVTSVTVRTAVERMLREADLSPTTLDDYTRVAHSIVIPYLGSVPLAKLTPPVIDEAWKAAAKHHTPHRIVRAHTVLSATCRLCLRWGWMSGTNVAHGAPPKEPPRPQREAVSRSVIEQLAAAVASELDLYVWLRLAIVTGARRGEVLGLQWRDVDWDGQVLTIARSVAYTPASGLVVKSTKTNRVRRVAMLSETLVILAELRDRPGQPNRPTDHILTSGDGAPWRPDYATYRFGKVRATVPGAEKVKLHELRSAAASFLLAAGHDLAVVANRLGHARPSVTLERYARALPESANAAAATMEDILPARSVRKDT
jgi:integrase